MDPLELFQEWFARARAVDRSLLPEPTAMALATTDSDGRPGVRMVLLKDADARGFVFYTNTESRKGRELIAHPRAALCFHWQPLELQVRIEGETEMVSDAEADAYFASRARVSQLGAWASSQSRVMAQDEDLEARLHEMERRFEGAAVPRPAYWSGFRVVPTRFEFWRNRPFRLHDRQLYERSEDGWLVTRLYP
ncbi:MAG: pyridoxamine 5'-phosphate oxidase [Gemmatimonadota bacterium]|nr:pyridoxamine 5'-phosphate oxidase [Gemmatimonadota bacterium]